MSFLAGMGFSAMSNPPTVTVPLVGGRKPVSIRMVVDLPAPFGPRKPSTSPRSTAKVIPSTARFVPNILVKFSTLIISSKDWLPRTKGANYFLHIDNLRNKCSKIIYKTHGRKPSKFGVSFTAACKFFSRNLSGLTLAGRSQIPRAAARKFLFRAASFHACRARQSAPGPAQAPDRPCGSCLNGARR